jgi:hypothetical protein
LEQRFTAGLQMLDPNRDEDWSPICPECTVSLARYCTRYTPEHRIVSVAEAKATIKTALAILKEIGHEDITAFADDFREDITKLLVPLA